LSTSAATSSNKSIEINSDPKIRTDNPQQEQFQDDLEKIMTALRKRFHWLEAKIIAYSDDEARVERYTNSEQRIIKSYLDCLALATDPRHRLSGNEDDDAKDLAKMIADVLASKKKKSADKDDEQDHETAVLDPSPSDCSSTAAESP
jgi:hypothetical protein